MEIFAASMAQATAMGAALTIHKAWNQKPFPNDIIELKYFSNTHYPCVKSRGKCASSVLKGVKFV
jgi:hypothetical protein